MRAAIRNRLIAAVSAVEGRVYEPQAAGIETAKPFLVIRQGIETEESDWAGFRRIIEVWPVVSRTSFQEVDTLARQVTDALAGQLLTTESGEVFTVLYLGTTGEDMVAQEWDAITRGLRFSVLALQPVGTTETFPSDSWVEALAAWTQQTLGQDWTLYRDRWPMGYRQPAVLWRLVSSQVMHAARATFKVTKQLQAHVIGQTVNQQNSGATAIVEGLGQAIKLPLNEPVGAYLTVADARADFRNEALTTGQVTVELFRFTARPTEEIPFITRVYPRGFWR
jgi:hypothetical protein